MQSVDEFTPSTTEPVFGSGLVSQTKSQPATNNDISDNEKVIPSSEPVVNGQNDTTVNKITSNENITNGTKESVSEDTGADDLSTVHVNGQNEKPTVETNNEVQPAEESTASEKSSQVEPTVPITEPKPILTAPVDTANESSSSVPTTTVNTAPPPAVETTTNDNVSEAPVATESETAEPKSKTPRGRAKAPVVSTTPTRQSSRGRQTASSSTNVEENQTINDTGATTTTNQIEPPKRAKRPAASIANDVVPASNQPTSTPVSSSVDDGNVQENNITEGATNNASPSATKKREAPTSATNATKKTKGKNSITSVGDVDSGAASSESETIQTPPKKPRTSANKKTPEPPSEDYVRKLRPRK